MMSETTRKEIERLAKKYKGTTKEWKAWERMINQYSNISFRTFIKYVKLTKVIKKEEVDLNWFVGFVNSLAGDDLYGADWHFEVIDGKVYETYELFTWN